MRFLMLFISPMVIEKKIIFTSVCIRHAEREKSLQTNHFTYPVMQTSYYGTIIKVLQTHNE